MCLAHEFCICVLSEQMPSRPNRLLREGARPHRRVNKGHNCEALCSSRSQGRRRRRRRGGDPFCPPFQIARLASQRTWRRSSSVKATATIPIHIPLTRPRLTFVVKPMCRYATFDGSEKAAIVQSVLKIHHPTEDDRIGDE